MSSLTLSLQHVRAWSRINQHQQMPTAAYRTSCEWRMTGRESAGPELPPADTGDAVAAVVATSDSYRGHVAYSAPSVGEWDAGRGRETAVSALMAQDCLSAGAVVQLVSVTLV